MTVVVEDLRTPVLGVHVLHGADPDGAGAWIP
jgi:hypothetical protein